MEHVINQVQKRVQAEEKTKEWWLKIYQIAVLMAAAFLLAIVPSLLVWKMHIMSAADPAVVMGLAGCFAVAAILIVFDIVQIRKLFV